MARQTKYSAPDIARALRLPFTAASALPFIFGSFAAKGDFDTAKFLLGLITAVTAHLSANVINDYADSKTSADWQDRKFYGFFGGSKLIQEGIFSGKSYLRMSIILASVSAFSIIALAVISRNMLILPLFLMVLMLAWSYSARPLQFSYHRFGEVIIFILFGPACVMGAYYIQTNIFPDARSFVLSLPFGFFTTAILYSNEIPDTKDDINAGKFTLASSIGEKRAYLLYYALQASAFLTVLLNVYLGYINPLGLLSLALIPLAVKAAAILKKHAGNKEKLVESSKLTISIQALAGLILIISAIL